MWKKNKFVNQQVTLVSFLSIIVMLSSSVPAYWSKSSESKIILAAYAVIVHKHRISFTKSA